MSDPTAIRFDDRGLAPAVVQDARDGAVLMLGYMNAQALAATRETGDVWFWSRSRSALWHKGETSGNVLRLVEIRADCDNDALLIRALPAGPTCHTGARSCFSSVLAAASALPEPAPTGGAVLDHLNRLIADRAVTPEAGSYTNHLLAKGVDRIGRKIGEEAAETIIAAKNDAIADLAGEVADLFYHCLVLLAARGIGLDEVGAVLAAREGAPRRHQEP
ncbi:MAG TPA: bifunctional phosphoribosyl-AMP cyclohydrolase/phosphoribosyl-ATP diphosphatase HisIE [Chloroflexota bacterium]|nr:bifunctional phosphoribosyl-AMP cyclohydrolase/phosphoribosyl-ATP diphosphatase HisIE [Chloroflexota bacterium]